MHGVCKQLRFEFSLQCVCICEMEIMAIFNPWSFVRINQFIHYMLVAQCLTHWKINWINITIITNSVKKKWEYPNCRLNIPCSVVNAQCHGRPPEKQSYHYRLHKSTVAISVLFSIKINRKWLVWSSILYKNWSLLTATLIRKSKHPDYS